MASTAFSEQQVQLNYFRLRLWFCGLVVLASLGILAVRFYVLQVVQHDHYRPESSGEIPSWSFALDTAR